MRMGAALGMKVSSTMKSVLNVPVLAATTAGLLFLGAVLMLAKTPVVAAAGADNQAQAKPMPGPATDTGEKTYARQCAICHGEQREGILPGFPPLLGIHRQMSDTQIADLLHKGKGRMPAFPKLQNEELASLLHYLTVAETPVLMTSSGKGAGVTEAGGSLFQQNCAFCHGRDTMGGESGPDLTQSKIVLADFKGDKIGQVVREGRLEKKMPAFNFSSQEVESLAAFIHEQVVLAASRKGGRRGVTVADLQTGNVEQGKKYFNGAGGCARCHSATGDLKGIATRYEGLHLEERMLYPEGAKSHARVTLPSGETVTGTVAYLDEWVLGVRDSTGTYRSWKLDSVKSKIDSPAEAHVEQFPKYTDADIHNLMAYLQTLR